MNLKEAFRYQKFLDCLMSTAKSSIVNGEHALSVCKTHKRSVAHAGDTDIVEKVEPQTSFWQNDDVIRFMVWLVEERGKLSYAINDAKRGCLVSTGLDIDAAIETNKFRQLLHYGIKNMLGYTASRQTTTGKAYCFNANGEQVPYYYDVDVVKEEAYDRSSAKRIMSDVIKEADRISSAIDSAMVQLDVKYDTPFDVNDSFDDVMEEFLSKHDR